MYSVRLATDSDSRTRAGHGPHIVFVAFVHGLSAHSEQLLHLDTTAPPGQYDELSGQAEQTRSVTFVHGTVSYVPAWHVGEHFCIPCRQYDCVGQAVQSLSETFVHAVVSYVPFAHSALQLVCTPCRQ